MGSLEELLMGFGWAGLARSWLVDPIMNLYKHDIYSIQFLRLYDDYKNIWICHPRPQLQGDALLAENSRPLSMAAPRCRRALGMLGPCGSLSKPRGCSWGIGCGAGEEHQHLGAPCPGFAEHYPGKMDMMLKAQRMQQQQCQYSASFLASRVCSPVLSIWHHRKEVHNPRYNTCLQSFTPQSLTSRR